MKSSLILLVGHCGPDSYALRSAVSRAAPGAQVVFINEQQELQEQLPRAELLLVNRMLDGGFDTNSGLDLIKSLAQNGQQANPPCMLISNFADAQAAAIEAGARPGFGKSQMNSEDAAARIREALEHAQSQ